jgi:glyoxylase-like metal-dependent hydrolase (beta-lactamase superfamily II)
VLDLQVGQVQANTPAPSRCRRTVPTFAERVDVQKVADGVWFLGGGSHNSVLVEIADHLMLVESPLYDGRTQAVLAEAQALVPNKPIRYVVNSHHHFDHAGGLRAAAATAPPGRERTGAAMVRQAFANPNRSARCAGAVRPPPRIEG